MDIFLKKHEYIDFSEQITRDKAMELFSGLGSDVDIARAAYEFVRDEKRRRHFPIWFIRKDADTLSSRFDCTD